MNNDVANKYHCQQNLQANQPHSVIRFLPHKACSFCHTTLYHRIDRLPWDARFSAREQRILPVESLPVESLPIVSCSAQTLSLEEKGAGKERRRELWSNYPPPPLNLRLVRVRDQELCESRGGRPGLPSLIAPTVSVDVKQHLKILQS